MAACQKWKPVIVIVTVYFLMAVMNILFKKILDEGMNQLIIMTYRLTAAAVFLGPIAYFCERRSGIKLTTPILCQLFFSALIGATITQSLFLIGIKYTSAAFSTAFINLVPVTTLLLALLLRQESANLRTRGGMAKVLGSLICIGGGILLILYKGIPLNKTTHSGKSPYNSKNQGTEVVDDSTQRWILGSAFLLISIVCWSGWFLIQARIGKRYPCKYSSTAFMSFFGAIQSAILCFAIKRDLTVWIVRGKLEILTVLFAGIFGSGLCYVGMSWCVQQRGPVFTSAFSPLVQIFIICLDLAFFHEQIYLGSVIGSMLVICGLYILLWGKAKAEVDNITKPAQVANPNGSSTAAADATQFSDSRCPA